MQNGEQSLNALAFDLLSVNDFVNLELNLEEQLQNT